MEKLAAERQSVRDAVMRLRLVPVMFELGAGRTHRERSTALTWPKARSSWGIYWLSRGRGAGASPPTAECPTWGPDSVAT